jgi:DNA-binding MarR family transcriptional regulator
MNNAEDSNFNDYSFRLDRTSRRVKQYAQNQFKMQNFGITVDQWAVLKKLNETNNLSQIELAEITAKDAPTLTRIIDILCKKGLTIRKADETDRRKFKVQLTESGLQKIQELTPKIDQIRQQAWYNLTKQDFEHFRKVLDTIYKNLE